MVDPIVIGLIIAAFNYRNDFDLSLLIWPSISIFVASIALGFGMGATIAATGSILIPILIFIPLYAIVAGMSLQRAMIAGAIFAAYKLDFDFVVIFAMS